MTIRLCNLLVVLAIVSGCKNDGSDPAGPTSGTIIGKVVTAVGDTAIAGATIITAPPTTQASTNSQGEYTITNVDPGSYAVTARKAGYDSAQFVVNVSAGKSSRADLHLAPAFPSQGIVAYYPFNGNANDESGNVNNGVVSGATLAADRFAVANRAYQFQTSNIIVASTPLLDLTASFSLSLWIRPSTVSLPQVLLQKHYRGIDNDGSYSLLFSDNAGGRCVYFVSFPNTNWSVHTKTVFPANQWAHVVFSHDQTTGSWRFDVNGSLDTLGRHTFDIRNNGKDFSMGFDHWSSTYGSQYSYTGLMDDIRMYNRTLSQSESSLLYHEGGW